MQLDDAREEATNTEELVDFSIAMIKDMPKLWRKANIMDKKRLQELLLPEGISYSFVEGFGTAKIGGLYGVIEQVRAENTSVVGAAGFEPATNRL